MEINSQHGRRSTHTASAHDPTRRQSQLAIPPPQCSMLPRGFWGRCCDIYVVCLTSRQVRPRAGNIEQRGARGQAVHTCTLMYGIARVANVVPSTVLTNAAEHWEGRCRHARMHRRDKEIRSVCDRALQRRTRLAMRLQGTGSRWSETSFRVCVVHANGSLGVPKRRAHELRGCHVQWLAQRGMRGPTDLH